jgi:hypothetical protein
MDASLYIPAHGPILEGKEAVGDVIEDYQYYLQKMLTSKGTEKLENCLRKDKTAYDYLEWHEINALRL